jgi:hypothetical protein
LVGERAKHHTSRKESDIDSKTIDYFIALSGTPIIAVDKYIVNSLGVNINYHCEAK